MNAFFLTKKRPYGVLPSVRPDFSMISTPSFASSLKPRESRIVANWPSRAPTYVPPISSM